jgi:hypothetical protein
LHGGNNADGACANHASRGTLLDLGALAAAAGIVGHGTSNGLVGAFDAGLLEGISIENSGDSVEATYRAHGDLSCYARALCLGQSGAGQAGGCQEKSEIFHVDGGWDEDRCRGLIEVHR